MNKLILASASPRRRELLEGLGLKFDIIVSNEEENIDKSLPPELYTGELALLKATAVAKRILERKKQIIIAADTVVYLEDEILEKPKDAPDAFNMIKRLSGKTHQVYTGLCVMRICDGTTVTRSIKTDVKFKTLSDEVIKQYISTMEYSDKAGGYAIQGKGAVLVEGIYGDYFNVVGLPLSALADVLRDEFGIDIFDKELVYES